MNWEHIFRTAPIFGTIVCIIWLLLYLVVRLIQTLYVPKERKHGRYEKVSRPENKIYNKQPGEVFIDIRYLDAEEQNQIETVRPAKCYRVIGGESNKGDQ